MPTPSADSEPTVNINSPMPKGYTFVRKGNVYITKTSRKLTQEANQAVYNVEDSKGKQLGLRVPQHIYNQVLRLNAATKDTRAEAVLRKDQALENKVRVELLKQFPKVPSDAVAGILKHTLKKRSRRVGRSTDVPVPEMVGLAVRAHIRHAHTQYDALLRNGMSREKARDVIAIAVRKKIEAWGGKVHDNHSRTKVRSERTTKSTARPKNSSNLSANPGRRDTKRPTPVRKKPLRPKQLSRRNSLRLQEQREREESEDLDVMDLDFDLD